MKTLIAAGLAASALAVATVASANPVLPVGYHHPVAHTVVVRGPIVYRHRFPIATVYARPVVLREGYVRPGFYSTAYYVHGYRGAHYHAHVWRHGPVHRHITLRGVHVGEHRPV